MSILDSSVAPVLILITGFAVLAAFFRKVLIKVIAFLVLEIGFFLLFPGLLVKFVNLVVAVRQALGR